MRTTACLLCLSVAMASPQEAPPEPAKNLIANGSLTSNASGWSRSSAGATFTRDTNQGKGSLSIHKKTPSKSPHNWWQAVALPGGGKPYNLELVARVRARGLAAGSTANVMVQLLDGSRKMIGGAWCTPVDKDSDWVETRAVFAVTRRCASVRVLAYFVGAGQVWFDDLRLTKTSKRPTARPRAGGQADTAMQALARGAASDLPWVFDVATALARAKREGKPILLYVRCTDDGKHLTSARRTIAADGIRWGDDGYMKDLMFRVGPLSDADVTGLIAKRFVPLCLTYILGSHGRGYPDRAAGADPLAALGLSAKDHVTPALVVLDSDGKPRRKLHRMGVYSAPLVDRWLRSQIERPRRDDLAGAALGREQLRLGQLDLAEKTLAGMESPEGRTLRGIARMRRGDWAGAIASLKAAGTPEASFRLGWCLARLGKHAEARAVWKPLAGKTRVGRRAAAWLLDGGWRPMLVNVMRDLTLPAGWEQTEGGAPSAFDAGRSLRALLELQREDGSFGGHRGRLGLGFSDAAISAIAGDALLAWKAKAPAALRPRMAAAHGRILAFLAAWSKRRSRGGGDSFNHAYALMHLVRAGDKQSAARVIARIAASQNPDGNWTVYQVARPASFNTALCLLALAGAKRAGHAVPAPAIAKGVAALAKMRQASGHFPYSTMKGHEWMTTDHGAIARNPLCESALIVNGRDSRQQLTVAFGHILAHHAELRRPSKMFYDYFNRRGHGGYYFYFAHRNAWEAAAHVPAPLRKKVRAAVRQALLSSMELDGTFVDSVSIGRAYGTGIALTVLAQAAE